MAQITSGRVVYSRKVQPAQFESEGAEVEFAFVLEDGEDAASAASQAGAAAKASALDLLGRRATARSDERGSRRERFRPREDNR